MSHLSCVGVWDSLSWLGSFYNQFLFLEQLTRSLFRIFEIDREKYFVSAVGFVSLFKYEVLMTTRIRKKKFFINYISNYILLLPGAELLQERNLSFLWIDNRHQPFGNSTVLLSLGSPPKDAKKLCTVLVLLIVIPIFSLLLLLYECL